VAPPPRRPLHRHSAGTIAPRPPRRSADTGLQLSVHTGLPRKHPAARTEDSVPPRYSHERRCDSIAATLKQANTAPVPSSAVSSSAGLTASAAATSGPSVAPWLNAAPPSSRYLRAVRLQHQQWTGRGAGLRFLCSPQLARDTHCCAAYKVGPLHARSRPHRPCRALPCLTMRAGRSCCRDGGASAACCAIRRPDELGLARGATGVSAPLVQVAGAGLQRRQPGGAADKAQHAQHRAHARHPVEHGAERGQPERAGEREVHPGEVLLHRARPARGAAWGRRMPRKFMRQAPLAGAPAGSAPGQERVRTAE